MLVPPYCQSRRNELWQFLSADSGLSFTLPSGHCLRVFPHLQFERQMKEEREREGGREERGRDGGGEGERWEDRGWV